MLKTLKNRSYLLVIVLMSIIIFKQLPLINEMVKVALASEKVQISEYTDGVGYDISWRDQIENLKNNVSYIVESSNTKVVEVVKKKVHNKFLL